MVGQSLSTWKDLVGSMTCQASLHRCNKPGISFVVAVPRLLLLNPEVLTDSSLSKSNIQSSEPENNSFNHNKRLLQCVHFMMFRAPFGSQITQLSLIRNFQTTLMKGSVFYSLMKLDREFRFSRFYVHVVDGKTT